MAMEQKIKTKKVGLDLLPDVRDLSDGERKEVRDYSDILFISF